MNPLFGYLVDHIKVLGYKKKFYMAFNGVIGFAVYSALANTS